VSAKGVDIMGRGLGPPPQRPGPPPSASPPDPWTVSRALFALALLWAQLRRIPHVSDALAAGVSLASGPARWVDAPVLSAPLAWGLWALGLGLAGAVLRGGRWSKRSLAGFLLVHAALLLGLGLDVRVPERVMLGGGVALLLGPIHTERPQEAPAARAFLWMWLASLYGSTGLFKALDEPAWWTGEAIRYHLLDRWHAGGTLSAWVSGQPALCRAIGVGTIVLELALPVMLAFRRSSPWALLVGLALHGGIALLMDVGPLGPLALALYPAAAHPEGARDALARLRRGLQRAGASLRSRASGKG
jgi:hypothetical protein